jgi:VanZ family protein
MSKYYLYPVLWVAFVTGLSVLPGGTLPKFDLFSPDKAGHFFVYGVLSFLILYGVAGIRGRGFFYSSTFVAAVFLSAAYGVLMEWVQYRFIPGRMYEYDDMIANAAGAVVGGISWRLWANAKHRKNQNAG